MSMLNLYKRFKLHLEENYPEIKGKKLLLAVSGGVDSMVLLDLMIRSKSHLSLAHCNFDLRGEDSEKDELFIREQAAEQDVKIHVIKFNTGAYSSLYKCSVQMAARDLRYSWFSTLLKKYKYDFVLTAHHADDNLETFLINLSRGTGLKGLCGIPEKNEHIIRPLLPYTRDDIEAYARDHKLKWREDLSNQDPKYLRNALRLKVVPLLKDLNPSFMDSFVATIGKLQGTKAIVSDRMKEVRKELIEKNEMDDRSVIRFRVDALSAYADNSAYLFQLFHTYGFDQWDDIRSLLVAQSGKQLFSKTHRLVKHRKFLLLSETGNDQNGVDSLDIEEGESAVSLGQNTLRLETGFFDNKDQIKFFCGRTDLACFDKDLLKYPLHVRKWEKGDYFYPFGMAGKKKLSKFFKDEKYSLLEKEKIWLLCSGSDVVWVIGKRMDDRYKITKKTKNILKARLDS